MSDLFHEAVPFEFISKVFDVIWKTNHAYLILTKRPEITAKYLEWSKANEPPKVADQDGNKRPNIWLGVTVENQKRADERIPILLQIPAAKRFVSLEPMLGPVFLPLQMNSCGDCGEKTMSSGNTQTGCRACGDTRTYTKLDRVIIGCESGPKRRPCNLDDVRSLVSQCKEAQVPCFVKQLSINGKVSRDMSEWPEDLRVRERPE
jgi:protein gp37